jgi:GT2 family glycosyltransferase
VSGEGAVTVAYLHPNDVAHSWHESMTNLVGYDLAHEQRVIRGGWLGMKCGAGGLDRGRTLTVEQFLRERDAEWLFWVDADMGFSPDVVDRLFEVADPVERPIVGGLCFAMAETTTDGFGGFRTAPRPTIFDWVDSGEKAGFQGRAWYPVNELVRCAGTGSACVLIHRSVFEKIAAEQGPVWYDRVKNPSTGELISEDLSFCVRAGLAGVPVYVHTGVRTTHQKTVWLGEPDWWAWAQAPPATEQTAVIVPVMRRPQNAEPFMRSLRASTGLATVYAIADAGDDDTIAAWRAAGADVLVLDADGPGTFAHKVNAAYGFYPAAEPWLFLTGDDVRFHPGWLDHAQAAGGDRYHVIGTNDLANPRVLAGEHATHLLVRRSYVDEVGGSWDGPGVVAHEGFRHWFVDDEIVTAAKQRGAWAMALGSRVEHLHPLWGTAPADEVYALGQSHAKADAELFRARLREHAS